MVLDQALSPLCNIMSLCLCVLSLFYYTSIRTDDMVDPRYKKTEVRSRLRHIVDRQQSVAETVAP